MGAGIHLLCLQRFPVLELHAYGKTTKKKKHQVGRSPGRGGLRLQLRPLGKGRLREGGLESTPWCTEGKESRHLEMLGSVLPLSDHLGKYRV